MVLSTLPWAPSNTVSVTTIWPSTVSAFEPNVHPLFVAGNVLKINTLPARAPYISQTGVRLKIGNPEVAVLPSASLRNHPCGGFGVLATEHRDPIP